MRQYDIRRAQGEIRAETRALDGVEVVEEGDGVGLGEEGGGEETAVAAAGVAARVVVGAGGAGFGVVDLFHWGEVSFGNG